MKTAVEWLFEQLDIVDSSISYEYFKQAKEMEKEQIEDAWENGIENCGEFNNPTIISGKQYYKETFKSE
jgi:hypothetical protein